MDSGDAIDRVINVHTSKPVDWVLENVLNEAICGPRKRVLFWKSDKPGISHFFIEFERKDSVARAQREAQPGVTIHCLARNPNMRSIFYCLASGIELPKKRTGATANSPTSESKASPSIAHSDASDSVTSVKTHNSLPTQPANKKRRVQDANAGPENAKGANTGQAQAVALAPPIRPAQAGMQVIGSQSVAGPSGPSKERVPPLGPQRLMNGNAGQRARTLNSEPMRFGKGPLQQQQQFRQQQDWQKNSQVLQDRAVPLQQQILRSHTSIASDTRPEVHTLTASSNSHFSSDASLLDQSIMIWKDPDSLSENDVEAVISSLKASTAGPESWMTVAASYRRRNLHKSALAVVTSMLEVMQNRGMTKADLKPALLMMAQCYYSIGKQENSDRRNNGNQQESSEGSSRYFVQLIEWLRKIYGTSASASDAISQSTTSNSFSSTTGGLEWSSGGSEEAEGLSGSVLTGSNLTSLTARLAALTAELESTGANRDALTAALVTARASKLQLEGSLRAEEGRRRSLEREIARVREELHDARSSHARMVQRETDARHRVEDRLAQCERRLNEACASAAAARGALEGVAAVAALAVRQPSSVESAREYCETRAQRARLEYFKPGSASGGAVPQDASSISSTP